MNVFTATMVGVLSVGGAAQAVTITSGDFSIGQGYVAESGWSDSEITNNVAPTASFSLEVTPSSRKFSDGGPTFIDRALGTGGPTFGSGDSIDFTATLAASYIDVLPPGAINVQTVLFIDSISIYGGAHPAFPGDARLQWTETTVGNMESASPVLLITSSDFSEPSSYTLVSWDPDDSGAVSSGTAVTRTFALIADQERYLDGFEVTGHIETSFDLVPEPGSLLGLGLGALALRRSRRA